MKRLALPVVVIALIGAFAFWWFSPVQIVKRRTETLLDTVTLEAGSGRGGRPLKGYTLNALLAPQVILDTPTIEQANGTFTRSEMESAFSWLCEQAKETRFELEEFRSVEVVDDEAVVGFTLEALVELPSYKPADGSFLVDFHWRREKDGWRLTRAVWREVD
jgi:hypothetical protein